MFKGSKPYICRGLFTIKLAIVLVICYIVVRIALLPEPLKKSLESASAMGDDKMYPHETISPSDLSSAEYAEMVKKNSFGTSGQTTDEGEETLTSNSTSLEHSVSDELGLVLFGTVSGNPMLAMALIKNVRTDVHGWYKTGQMVAGARIETIERYRIILTYNGEKKVLELSTMQSDTLDYNTQALSSKTANEIQDIARTDSPTEKNDSGALTRIEQVSAILNKAVIEPYVTDGQIRGLRISNLENTDIVNSFGLKNNDVICTIDGQLLTSKQKALQILKKLRSQPSANIELLRDNVIKELSFTTK